jgi:hypothetical protein
MVKSTKAQLVNTNAKVEGVKAASAPLIVCSANPLGLGQAACAAV